MSDDGPDMQRAAEEEREKLAERGYRFAWAGMAISISAFWLIGVVRGGGILVVWLGLWLLGFVAACIGLIFAVRGRAVRASVILCVVCTGLIFLYGLLSPVITHLMCAPLRVEQCQWNLGVLGERLIAHSRQSEGGILVGEQWCDVLSRDETVRDSFRCHASLADRRQSSYALNEAVVGKSIDSLPGGMVLLFESVPGWNVCGGAELLVFENHRLLFGRKANVVLVAGTIITVTHKESLRLRWQ
jgi:hypothetical protein